VEELANSSNAAPAGGRAQQQNQNQNENDQNNQDAEWNNNANNNANANNEDCDRFSFEDSDRFEEDSLCSWSSEPESLCNNWRGWKRPMPSVNAFGSNSNRKSAEGGEFITPKNLSFFTPTHQACVCCALL
jgi:hypothetical protein